MTEARWRGGDQSQNTRRNSAAFVEQHFPVRHWAELWGFSEKTVRDWFRGEYGPSILRQPNIGRRSKRDYTTVMVSPSAAARVYEKRTRDLQRRTREVM